MIKIRDLINLLYPEICAACQNHLLDAEKGICYSCLINLPHTNFHLQNFNPLKKLFKYRVEISDIAAMYYFSKHSKVQHLLHAIKYQKATVAAEKIGTWYGYDLQKNTNFQNIDYIIPVPLHSEKLKKRGYNQSEFFAKGICNSMPMSKLSTEDLVRVENNESQTKKSRIGRIENIENAFALNNPEKFTGKNVLLVDDVVTTGATIEACGNLLQKANTSKLLIATIACAIKI